MTPEEELERVLQAIRESASGYLVWNENEAKRVRHELASYDLKPVAIQRLLQRFVRNGGEIEARTEEREQWMDRRERWYLAIIPMIPFVNGLFVECWLLNRDPEAPVVEIVNAHPER